MKIKFVAIYLSKWFKLLGKVISQRPIYFIVIPFVISIVLSTGYFRLKKIRDIEYLFNADNGRYVKSKRKIDSDFPLNMSSFGDVGRLTDRIKSPIIFVLSKQAEDMLQYHILKEIKILDNIIKNVTIIKNGKEIAYDMLCGILFGKCFENPIMNLIARKDKGDSNWNKVKYPLDIHPLTFSIEPYLMNLGGVTVDDNDFVKKAEAIRLIYSVDETHPKKKNWINEWVNAVFDRLDREKFQHIRIIPGFFNIMDENYATHLQSIIPLSGISIFLILLFTAVLFLTNNWQRSKPWLGICSCLSAGLAVCSSFGFAFHCGLQYSDTNISIPFLVIATEIDDACVLLASWRSTSFNETVENRMSQTYAEAAVSITLTSLTNFVAYCIGLSAPFPVVRLFCAYAAISIFFTYFYQITFFGGCMAVSGYQEHIAIEEKVYVKTETSENMISSNERKSVEEYCMKIFRDNVNRIITWIPTKVMIMLLYFANLGLGIWGISQLKEGLDYRKLFPPGTSTESLEIYYKYFSEYSFVVQVVIEQQVNYADPAVQNSIIELTRKIESHPLISSKTTFSWLRYYKFFLNQDIAKFSMNGYNVSLKEDFIDGLRQVFLRIKGASIFQYDINFNENEIEIISSRLMFQSANIHTRTDEINLMKDLHKIAEDSEIPIYIFSIIDSFVEQVFITRAIVVQLVWVTALVIIILFFLFIPDVICTILVSISVVSSIIVTIGLMSIWNIHLDMMSAMVLILSVGFSVNYPTHFAFAFLNTINSERDYKKRMQQALYLVAFPIFQGSITTIVGVCVFSFVQMYVFTTFFKVVFVIVLQTFFHSMFFLPVAISLSEIFHKKYYAF